MMLLTFLTTGRNLLCQDSGGLIPKRRKGKRDIQTFVLSGVLHSGVHAQL